MGDKDSIRNMAMNYTFSGKSSTSQKTERLNSTINTATKKSEKTHSESDKNKVSKKEVNNQPKKLGPAAPSLDADALKALTKGLVGKKKKSKKKTHSSEKESSEYVSEASKENKSVEAVSEDNKIIKEQVTSPRSKELRDAKSKIQELQEEIERLKAIED